MTHCFPSGSDGNCRGRWAEDEALRELARLARDLPDVDAAEAWRRLGRLTREQREA